MEKRPPPPMLSARMRGISITWTHRYCQRRRPYSGNFVSMRSGEMSGVQYISCRELHPDTRPPVELTGDPSFSHNLARRLPHLVREKRLDFGETDKIFTSKWLSEEEVVVGTKCNKLFVVDTVMDRTMEIPTLSTKETDENWSSCGIHCICVTQDQRHLATGGCNPREVAVYGLPEFEPVVVGVAHRDWIFDMEWITDSLLITGSRDSTMALWSIAGMEDSRERCLAEDVPSLEPIFRFANLNDNMESYALAGERVRSLAYNKQNYTLASLQTNPCGAAVYFWDVYVFEQTMRAELPCCVENVCIETDPESSHLYAVGSRSHVMLIDGREDGKSMLVDSIKSLDKDCGVRSLQFNSHLLSIGTGAGHLYFYDIRARKYLNHDAGCRCTRSQGKSQACSLTTSPGWLRHDQTYRDFFSGSPEPPNALYTHCYSPMKTKLFAAGGPLPLGLCGNYAAVWL